MPTIEELITKLYEQTSRARQNPGRALADAFSTKTELPISILDMDTAPLLTTVQWADWIKTDEVIDRFTNTGNSNINLNSRLSDSGHTWTVRRGAIGISNGSSVGGGV